MPKTIVLGGKEVYVLSRLGIMAILSFTLNTIALSRYCSLSVILLISVFSVITGAAISLMTVSFSQNRMKGMAITKLSGLIVISSFVPFFADKNIWWTVSFIPPFLAWSRHKGRKNMSHFYIMYYFYYLVGNDVFCVFTDRILS
ncbi:MAG: hypothetical protein ACI4NB_00020 [Candidatus Ornithospirochaeta sp.]